MKRVCKKPPLGCTGSLWNGAEKCDEFEIRKLLLF